MWTRICYGKRDMPFNYSEFICDTEEDLDNLPTNEKKNVNGSSTQSCSVGSQATIVQPKKVYVLNNNNEWVLLKDYTATSINIDTSDLDIASLDEVRDYLNI